MSTSYAVTEAVSFTITDARRLASKVATDLKRIQRFYDAPSDDWIAAYESEMTSLLKGGYLSVVTYGFKRNGAWIEPTVRYTAQDLAGAGTDDDPGRIRPGANVTGATFTSHLESSSAWYALSEPDKQAFKSQLSFQRSYGVQSAISGYLQSDRIYSAGGRALQRSTVRSW